MIKPFLSASLLGLAAAGPVSAVSLINLNFSGAMTGVQQQTFVDAAAYWNSTITGYELAYLSSGVMRPHQLTIDVSLPYIDGAYGILGSAGPTEGITILTPRSPPPRSICSTPRRVRWSSTRRMWT
jgi:hypothetical protein